MQVPMWRMKKSSLDRAVSDRASRSLRQIGRSPSQATDHLQLNESRLATVRQYKLCGNHAQIAEMTGSKGRCVITRGSLRNEQETKLRGSRCGSLECQVRCDCLCAGWLRCSNCWCKASLCFGKQSFTSVVCYPMKCIHGFKSTVELNDEKVESMSLLPGLLPRNLGLDNRVS